MIELQQAGFYNFLRTIFWIVFVYYAFKFLMRLLAPYLMKKVVDKMQEKAGEYRTNQQPDVKEGEIIIDKKSSSTKRISDDAGEYIDFEEVE